MFEFSPFPPPGDLVDIGTHKLHVLSQGEGSPVVVLDTGAGENVLSWRLIQSEIAKFTQVVAYDRSGLGWSERGPNPKSRNNGTNELHALLTKLKLPGPYVLVGHSLGGIHIRLFAKRYPELVAGLVLVDGAHEDTVSRLLDNVSALGKYIDEHIKRFAELSLKSHNEIINSLMGKEISDLSELPEDMQIVFDRYRPSQCEVVAEESKSFILAQAEQQPTALESFSGLPMITLTAAKPFEEFLNKEDSLKVAEIQKEMQKQIAGLSLHGKQILVEDAGHYIQYDQPQVVIDAIREVVEIVRQQATD